MTRAPRNVGSRPCPDVGSDIDSDIDSDLGSDVDSDIGPVGRFDPEAAMMMGCGFDGRVMDNAATSIGRSTPRPP